MSGADASDFGYEYQLFVCLYELILLSIDRIEGKIAEGSIVRQGRGRVDDLHVTANSDTRAIQVKGGPSVSWDEKLVDALWEEHETPFLEGTKSIEVCVGSEDVRSRLDAIKVTGKGKLNTSPHNLTFVCVTCVPEAWRHYPYRHTAIRHLLEKLTNDDAHDDLMGSTWYCFFRAFEEANHKGNVLDILLNVDRISRYTTPLPQGLPVAREHTEFVQQLNDNIEQLLFATDGSKLIVTNGDDDDVGYRPDVYPLVKFYEALKDDVPQSFDDFLAVVRPLKR